MNKKNLLMMMVTICLIAVVGVGSTLAYLSSKTDVMTNTFTVGNVTVTQHETSFADGTDIYTGVNEYTNILPGQELVKDPTATVKEGSAKCYVFMNLDGADELKGQLFTFNEENKLSSEWTKVSGEEGKLDGVYQYIGEKSVEGVVDAKKADVELAPLFETVTYSIDAVELPKDTKLSDVKIQTCAIQADYMDGKDIVAEAMGLFGSNNNQ